MPFKSANIQIEYQKCPELKPEDVRQFLDWAEKQPHLPNITELQAILFLHSCHYSHEIAKIAIDNFFTVKTLCFDIFGNRNPLTNRPTAEALNVVIMSILPKITPEGYIVYYIKIVDPDPSSMSFDQQIRAFDMAMMVHLNTEGTNNGVQVVFDMNGVQLGHLLRVGLVTLKKFFFYFQNAMPIRIKGLHFVNVVPFIDKILALMKPFMKKELLKMIHVHMNPQDLYKFIPRSCMPKEFGGMCESISVLHEKYKLTIKENADFLQNEDLQLIDETKRPDRPKNVGDVFGIDGTFKKLNIID